MKQCPTCGVMHDVAHWEQPKSQTYLELLKSLPQSEVLDKYIAAVEEYCTAHPVVLADIISGVPKDDADPHIVLGGEG